MDLYPILFDEKIRVRFKPDKFYEIIQDLLTMFPGDDYYFTISGDFLLVKEWR